MSLAAAFRRNYYSLGAFIVKGIRLSSSSTLSFFVDVLLEFTLLPFEFLSLFLVSVLFEKKFITVNPREFKLCSWVFANDALHNYNKMHIIFLFHYNILYGLWKISLESSNTDTLLIIYTCYENIVNRKWSKHTSKREKAIHEFRDFSELNWFNVSLKEWKIYRNHWKQFQVVNHC